LVLREQLMRPFLQNACNPPRALAALYAAVIGSKPTKLYVSSIIFGMLVLLRLPALAVTPEQSQLIQAQKLSDQGDFAGVIRLLEPMVHSESGMLDEVSRGIAWNILGSAYQDLGEYEMARRCYETVGGLLRTRPDAGSIYASALSNLGSLEIYMGQLTAAETLLRKAKALYAKIGDHTGLVAVAINLATLAIVRSDTHAAHRFLADAFGEADKAKNSSDSDRAAMYSIKGSLAEKDRDFEAAIRAYQESIELWIRARGPKCYCVALEYALQAGVYSELRDYGKAENDIIAALALVEQTVGRNTPLYAATELTYARLLRAKGENAEADQKQAEAKAHLEAMRLQQCGGCSITVAGFR
jgi:tetratricopeptide (TPR) repeat protein